MTDPVHDMMVVRIAELAQALADAHLHFTYPVWMQSEKLLNKDWVQEAITFADELKVWDEARIREAAKNPERPLSTHPLAQVYAGGIPYA